MRDERARRRPGFRRGTAIRLADGQDWWLPMPADLARPGSPGDAEYPALVSAVRRADDEADLRRAELALAIYLLDRNYDLRPDEISALLSGTSPAHHADGLRSALRSLAELHAPNAPHLPAGGHAGAEASPWDVRAALARATARLLGHRAAPDVAGPSDLPA